MVLHIARFNFESWNRSSILIVRVGKVDPSVKTVFQRV
uniref:Uncharacterized protein n=1 Tax=Pseudomonas aeruginosa TaxID=287 RepID=A0A2L1KHV8_PSEAI|nr:Hypothetical protein [Pseudomonas aeruginosa]